MSIFAITLVEFKRVEENLLHSLGVAIVMLQPWPCCAATPKHIKVIDCECILPCLSAVPFHFILTHHSLPIRLRLSRHPTSTPYFRPSENVRTHLILLFNVPNRSHPRCSPVARRQSEQHSSPSEEPAPQLQLRHTPNSVAQKWSKQHSSPSQEPAPSPSQLQRRLPNSGLGNRDRLNTMEVGVVRHSKVRRQTLGLQAVILIEIMPEQFRILNVEARCRCSRGWKWAPV